MTVAAEVVERPELSGVALSAPKPTPPRRGERLVALMLALPATLVVAGVYVYPAVVTLLYSVSKMDVSTFSIVGFVGLDNFAAVFNHDAFRETLLRTIYFGTMLAILTLAPSFFIGLLLNQTFRGRTVLRAIVLLPWAVPPVVGGVLWGQMFQPEFGFINRLLRSLGLPSDTIWLGQPTLALHAVLIAEAWRWIPFATLFILAGFQTIPRETLEAASVDGASTLQRLRHVTFPQLAPMLLPIGIFLFVWAMKAFDSIYVLTRGGPANSTTTMNYLVYQEGFEQFQFGQAAATAWVLTLVTIAAIALLRLIQGLVAMKGPVQA